MEQLLPQENGAGNGACCLNSWCFVASQRQPHSTETRRHECGAEPAPDINMCPHRFEPGALSLEPFPSCLFQPWPSLSRCRPHTQLQRRKAQAQKQHPPTKRRPEAARGHSSCKQGSPGPVPPLQDPRPQLPSGAVLPAGTHSLTWLAADQKTLFLNSKNKAKRPENNCSDFLALMKCLHFDTDRLFNYMRDFFSLALLPH